MDIIEASCNSLKEGGLVVVPSDTVYGLAVDATNEKAVKKLLDFKSRPPGKAVSVFIKDLKEAEKYVKIGKSQKKILEKILPGPFTVILPSRHSLVPSLESEKGTLGIRIIKNKLISSLLQKYDKPITATSANLSGRPAHYSIESLLKSLPKNKKDQLDFVVDLGKLPLNPASTVIDLTFPAGQVLRKTFISQSPDESKKIAKSIFIDLFKKAPPKPIIILLQGELGVGKTIFVKGIGQHLGIHNIISPTFVISHEYEVKNKKIEKLYHMDLYRIEEEEEFNNLGFDEMLGSKNLICIEWGEKASPIFDMFKKKAKIISIKMKYLNKNSREIAYENISN